VAAAAACRLRPGPRGDAGDDGAAHRRAGGAPGVKLLLRTTRKLSLTFEGSAFLEDCQRILNDLANAEASVSLGGVKASGHIKVSAPAGFGRRHVAPLLRDFLRANPEVSCSLDLSDRLVDLVNEGVDCAIRIGELSDSSLVSVRLGDNRRVVVASPAYLARCGTRDARRSGAPRLPVPRPQRGWVFADPDTPGQTRTIKVSGRFECNDGTVLHDWALGGIGLAWRSMWEVERDLASGALVSVLDRYAAPPTGIYAVFPQNRRLPLRVRLLIDHLRGSSGGRTTGAAALKRHRGGGEAFTLR
jgi:DNA-binding transcriptional LysR family regulator